MEILTAFLGFLIIYGFFVIVRTVKKISYKQDLIYKLIAEQNNLLSEQITIMRDDQSPSGTF